MILQNLLQKKGKRKEIQSILKRFDYASFLLGGARFDFMSLYCQIQRNVDQYAASRDNSSEKYHF
jgi:hypothetical protein